MSFAKQAFERAIKSAAQAEIGLIPLSGLDVLHVDWKLALGVGGGALVLSLLTSVASLPFGQKGSPSAVKTDGSEVYK
jgi:hypothetical protein